MKETPTVSVVIPTFNRAHQICEAVDSALAQTWQDAEVIVVDDGSSDNTRDVLEHYRSRIRYIHQDNKGVSAARNAGIREAQGQFISILDSDDLWLPEKVALQMQAFAENPSLGLVSCFSRFVDLDGHQLDESTPAPVNPATQGRIPLRTLLLGNCVSGGSNAVIRRECLDAVGLFDENLVSAEDWEMWIRIAKRFPIGFVTEALTIVRVSPNSMSAPAHITTMLESELRVLEKHCSGASCGVGLFDRRRSYSERYGRAAWAYLTTGDHRRACACILKALTSNPVHCLRQRAFVGLLVRVLAGDRTFAYLSRLTRRRETR